VIVGRGCFAGWPIAHQLAGNRPRPLLYGSRSHPRFLRKRLSLVGRFVGDRGMVSRRHRVDHEGSAGIPRRDQAAGPYPAVPQTPFPPRAVSAGSRRFGSMPSRTTWIDVPLASNTQERTRDDRTRLAPCPGSFLGNSQMPRHRHRFGRAAPNYEQARREQRWSEARSSNWRSQGECRLGDVKRPEKIGAPSSEVAER